MTRATPVPSASPQSGENPPSVHSPRVRRVNGATLNGLSDLPPDGWKDSSILSDSLWILGDRDNSGAHDGHYHGNFIPQIPHQLMRRFTRAGNVVLDTFLGSGTTMIEAKRLGRSCIGVELLPDVAKAAKELVAKQNMRIKWCKIRRMENPAKKPTFSDAIEMVLRDHGGHASLRVVYRDFPKYREMTGQTPEQTIQERVQRDSRFVRVGFGVYALKSYKDENQLPTAPAAKTPAEKEERRHTAVQGMLIEIGNNTPDIADTYTPDKSGVFDNKRLGSIATLEAMPNFTFPEVMKKARNVDVAWFNKRRYPAYVFEVEHSTNFLGAMTKFCELQDFQTRFCCVAESRREKQFKEALGMAAFVAIATRCKFYSYEQVESDYKNSRTVLHIR